MKFRPCIDLHDGVVKQIVGGTLTTAPVDAAASSHTPAATGQHTHTDGLVTNFVATLSAADYARMYAKDGLTGGHVIMLSHTEETKRAALEALRAYPGGLQVGGGINPENAHMYVDAGASHVIVTSYVFRDGMVDWDRLKQLVDAVGKERLVLDLSCRKRPTADGGFEYVVVTDRWQRFTNVRVDAESLRSLAGHCAEFLIHGVDVEGLRAGIEDGLVEMLGTHSPIPCTYAGGVRDLADVERVARLGRGKVDVTIGSALDIFGGSLAYRDVITWCAKYNVDSVAGSSRHEPSVEHDTAGKRFLVTTAAGDTAYLLYTLDAMEGGATVVNMRSTVVPEAFRGQGIAGRLAKAAFEWSAGQGFNVKPTCSYIRDGFLPKHAAYHAMVV